MGILHKASGVFEERGDTDWFRMKLVAGQTYEIKGPANASLSVILPNGEVLTVPLAFSNYTHFVAPVSGDYFLSASSLGVTGFYTLTVEDVLDPHPSTVTTPDSLAVGGTVTVTDNPNSTSFDDDWFAIDVVAGQSYLLSTSAPNGRVYVVNGAGETIAVEGNVGQGSSRVHFTATETGRLYAGAQHPGGSTYTLSLDAVADDHGDSPAGAGTLLVGTPVNGTWETSGDDDAYAVSLTAGSSYSFDVDNADITQPGFTRILDQTGALVWSSQTQAIGDVTTFSPDADGTYYVLAGANSNTGGPWTYSLAATVVANDLTDNVLTTGTLAVGGQAASVFDTAGDRDWFKVDLVQGQSYLFTMNAQNPQDARLALYDAQGHLVESVSNATFGSQLHHTAETTGTYFIAALPGQQPGTYTLTADAVADDFADNSSTTGVVVNGLMSGTFEVANDVDWFAVNLVAGRTYSLQGPFAVYDAQGNALTEINWGDASFTAAASGTYYLAASGSVGDYEYGIVQITDDFLESADTLGVVRQEVSGTQSADTFVSTDRYEYFMGLGGDDLFIAGTGYDRFEGGAGIDTLSYAGSVVGMDINLLLSRSQINGLFDDAIVGIENVIGSSLADSITGSNLANQLDGGGGADVLRGAGGDDVLIGGADADMLIGGAGNDYYRVEEAADQVVETVGGGTDTVYAVTSYALAGGSEVERLVALNPQLAERLDLTGNEFANLLIGNAGLNVLIGGGGADVLIGGAGNDYYRVEEAADLVVEAAGEGTDTVYAVTSYALAAGSEVETLMALDPASTAALNLTGNEFANLLIGNAGTNVLIGGGGADVLFGGAGNDYYRVEDQSDQVIEASGEGTDTVYAVTSYALSAGSEVENLIALDLQATDRLDLTGNEFANALRGNAGVNVLIGGGGADALFGGAGNDYYRVEDQSDEVIEAAGEGADTVYAVTSYALAAGSEVENLIALDPASTSALNLTGNEFANALRGNAGDNILDGGAGNDTLIGDAGADTFAFTTALGSGNVDTIADFAHDTDRIALDDAVFTHAGGLGTLDASAFVTGTQAADGSDRIIYNSATGELFYDADGAGGSAQILFATVQAGTVLSASDFQVI